MAATPAAPSSFFSPAAPTNLFGAGPSLPAATLSAARPAATASAFERPPLQSLLDVGLPREPAAAAADAPLPAKTPATSHRAAPAPHSQAPPPSVAAARVGPDTGTAGADSGLWVTAFGYHSTAMLASVLEELRPSGGELLAHRTGAGPWVHVRYADWRQQQQALAKNGKVLHGSMLGVIAGIHPPADTAAGMAAPPSLAHAIPLRLQQQRPVGCVRCPGHCPPTHLTCTCTRWAWSVRSGVRTTATLAQHMPPRSLALSLSRSLSERLGGRPRRV